MPIKLNYAINPSMTFAYKSRYKGLFQFCRVLRIPISDTFCPVPITGVPKIKSNVPGFYFFIVTLCVTFLVSNFLLLMKKLFFDRIVIV